MSECADVRMLLFEARFRVLEMRNYGGSVHIKPSAHPHIPLYPQYLMAKKLSLGKHQRLKSRKAIEQLFAEGKRFTVAPIRVTYIYKQLTGDEPGNLQVGVTVSSKNFKRAVDRNRIRRLLREAWRLQKNSLQERLEERQSSLSVFLIYTGEELPMYNLVSEKLQVILKKLIKLVDENPIAHT